MALGKGSKIGIGLLAVIILVGGAAGIYIKIWSSKHRVDYGKKHQITKDEASQIDRFRARATECKTELFGHKDFPYKAPPTAAGEGFAKAIDVMVKEVKTCLGGQKSADGKGYSVQMQGKDFEPVLAAKTCGDFATSVVKLKACPTLFEQLIDEAGFKDPLEDSGMGAGKDAGGDMGADMAVDMGADTAADMGTDMAADMGTDMAADMGTDMAADMAGAAGDMGAADAMK
jgi:hypothetical protein